MADFPLFDAAVDTRFQVRQIVASEAGNELQRIEFDEDYWPVAEKKYHHFVIKAHALSAPGANILKQTCLSLGTDAGVHRGAINCTIDREAVLITATQAQLEKLIQKLRPQPFGLKALSESLRRMLQRQKVLNQKPIEVMAVLNVTPDSFSDGGRLSDEKSLLNAAEVSLSHGAHILDIGGESTRPGAAEISVEEELSRILPAVKLLHQHFPQAILSIDTRRAAVAKAALDAGVSMLNDVSGLTFDPEMMGIVAQAGCRVVMMHSQGTPQTMQQNPTYDDLMGEITAFFYQQIAKAQEVGVALENIILDPGIGFGKTRDHSLEIMRRLPEIVSLGFPVLVGTSRKSFLTLGESIPVEDREALTAASVTTALMQGAQLVRVHDVATQMPVIRWTSAMLNRSLLSVDSRIPFPVQ